MATIQSFRDLRVFQAAFALAMRIFEISKGWPREERFELTSQIRRSSRSVCACVVEAWRKRRYPAAFISKLNDAEAEAAETRAWLDFALACEYLTPDEHRALDRRYHAVLSQLVHMIDHADQWAVGPPGGKGGSPDRARDPQSPSPGGEMKAGQGREPTATRSIPQSRRTAPRR